MIPSDATSQTQTVISEIELLAEEARKMKKLASEGTKKNSMSHSHPPYADLARERLYNKLIIRGLSFFPTFLLPIPNSFFLTYR